MSGTVEPRLLILETSGRVGQVAVALGPDLLEVRRLDETRRHARDLAPAVAGLLAGQALKPRDLHGVIVSRGPGSYTGLRVGIMSAKALAYATGCTVVAIDTFAAIALQAPGESLALDVLADAQQDKLYVQHFKRVEGVADWQAGSALEIVAAEKWLKRRAPDAWVTGPGLQVVESRLPEDCRRVPKDFREPQPPSLLRLGLARHQAGLLDDPWKLEPLYARPSSAEENWQGKAGG